MIPASAAVVKNTKNVVDATHSFSVYNSLLVLFMEIARIITNYTPIRADILRQAMGKINHKS
jgi:hypothetical protein